MKYWKKFSEDFALNEKIIITSFNKEDVDLRYTIDDSHNIDPDLPPLSDIMNLIGTKKKTLVIVPNLKIYI